MAIFPKSLSKKFLTAAVQRELFDLEMSKAKIDFFSNDYLGLSTDSLLLEQTERIFFESFPSGGATGSRLISGNHPLYQQLEKLLCDFYEVKSALVFNSGYQANTGLLSAVLHRQDVILYDALSHASIKDGIRLGFAKGFAFQHNNIEDLLKKILLAQKITAKTQGNIYVAIETLYSMDGDVASLSKISNICRDHLCYLITDEAHATGIIGENGRGLGYAHRDKLFAQVHTFGKAIGAHGAAICGDEELKNFLVNFSRPFIYTTALPPHSLARLCAVYQGLISGDFTSNLKCLWKNIDFFIRDVSAKSIAIWVSQNRSPIQTIRLQDQEKCIELQRHLSLLGFKVKAVFAPTVSKGQERIRICLHSFNTSAEISKLIASVKAFLT